MAVIAWLLLLLVSTSASGADLNGRIVAVLDGDTVTLLTAGHEQVRIRLAQIDAPEKSQPYGKASKAALGAKVFRQQVRVRVVTTDRYGRTVGTIFMADRNINLEMVRDGHAWAYRQYVYDKRVLAAEAQARGGRRGLWALQEGQRIPPWVWRHNRREESAASQPRGGDAPRHSALALPATCGAKTTCRQMDDCAEATHYLRRCGLTRLDGDGDGVPCDALCRR